MSKNHHCVLSEDFITQMSQDLGGQIEDLEGSWAYALPPQALNAQTISIGRGFTYIFYGKHILIKFDHSSSFELLKLQKAKSSSFNQLEFVICSF